MIRQASPSLHLPGLKIPARSSVICFFLPPLSLPTSVRRHGCVELKLSPLDAQTCRAIQDQVTSLGIVAAVTFHKAQVKVSGVAGLFLV